MPDPLIHGGSRTKTLDELMEEQGVPPVTVEELAVICASWPEDHDPEKMLAFILENRRRHYRPQLLSTRRMFWTAAIVTACIVLAFFVIGWLLILRTSAPPNGVPAGSPVGASCFLTERIV